MSIRLPEKEVSPGTAPIDGGTGEVSSVTLERVNPATLLLMEQLFPGHHGIIFLAGLLRQAVAKQLALPELELYQAADVAVVTAQSLRVLAQLIGMSYDTTEKYVVVLSRLRLLVKRRQQGQIVLHFPLSPCTLPEPEALDDIQGLRPTNQKPRYRSKVRSFAHQVKRRLVLLKEQVQHSALSAPPTPHTAQLCETLLTDIRHILQQEVDSTIENRLFLKIEGAVRYRCSAPASRLSSTNGDSANDENTTTAIIQLQKSPSPALLVDSDATKKPQSSIIELQKSSFAHISVDSNGQEPQQESSIQQQKSPFDKTRVDFNNIRREQESRLSFPKGDSNGLDTQPRQKESPFATQKDDFEHASRTQKSPLVAKKDDFEGATSRKKSPITSKKGDFSQAKQHNDPQNGRLSATTPHVEKQTGNSEVSRQVSNVNVITFLNMINVNVSIVAKFCCQALGEPPLKVHIYQKLFQECEHDAQAVAAALLFTLVHRRDGTMRNPAAVFVARCRDFHYQGIPDDAAALVAQYGPLTYTQLLDALSKSVLDVAPPLALPRSGPPSPGTPPSLLPVRHESNLTVRIPLQAGGGMSLEMARQLRSHVARDLRVGLCRRGLVRLKDGTYAVLLDHTITSKVRQTAFYSLAEWQTRSATMVNSLSLFAPEEAGQPPHRRRFELKGPANHE